MPLWIKQFSEPTEWIIQKTHIKELNMESDYLTSSAGELDFNKYLDNIEKSKR